MPNETVPLTFRIDARLKRELDALAVADFRSTASLLNSIIARHLAGEQQRPNSTFPQLAAVNGSAPEPAPAVYYTKPKGRPVKYDTRAGPDLQQFARWLERQEDPDTITPDQVADDHFAKNPSPRPFILAAARQLLTGSGYSPMIAHHPDGSEEEVWRKTTK